MTINKLNKTLPMLEITLTLNNMYIYLQFENCRTEYELNKIPPKRELLQNQSDVTCYKSNKNMANSYMYVYIYIIYKYIPTHTY